MVESPKEFYHERSWVDSSAEHREADLPSAEMHLLDTGHFALEDKLNEMAPLIHGFIGRHFTAR
jgi:hypothetical protein